jgi:hypothetical protein
MSPLELFAEGCVIPAHPLALTADRKLDERRQKAVGRYYAASGAGGMAVGVHTTQFPIHDNGMLKPVLEIALEAAGEAGRRLAESDAAENSQRYPHGEIALEEALHLPWSAAVRGDGGGCEGRHEGVHWDVTAIYAGGSLSPWGRGTG